MTLTALYRTVYGYFYTQKERYLLNLSKCVLEEFRLLDKSPVYINALLLIPCLSIITTRVANSPQTRVDMRRCWTLWKESPVSPLKVKIPTLNFFKGFCALWALNNIPSDLSLSVVLKTKIKRGM